jgi:hypothetical protein
MLSYTLSAVFAHSFMQGTIKQLGLSARLYYFFARWAHVERSANKVYEKSANRTSNFRK